tara:strand:+ start:1015 stop:1578 length:564 start_codon:yes stop_codon:yes gene_type:complete
MVAGILPAQLAAEEAEDPPERIDILIPQGDFEGPLEDCSAEQEAATISGEIIVCRRRRGNDEYGFDAERARQRYAEETMNQGDIRAPDVAGAGIFRGPATVSGVCGIGLNPCPPPPAYIVDFSALPEAPPGSDADRMARGLAPLGNAAPAQQQRKEVDLGLPPVPTTDRGSDISPSESASPEVEPSG